MTTRTVRARAAVTIAGLAALTIASQSQTQQGSQPGFRAATDLVTIDVSVRSNGTPVAGLTPADFVVLDNGVRQTIALVEVETLPIDVSILVDVNEDVSEWTGSMSGEIPRMAAALRPADRLRVTAINTLVSDLVALQPAATAPSLGRLAASGLSSAHDGLAAALIRDVDAGRRHLIVALTNGIDATSTLDAAAVLDIARRSAAVLHIAQVDMMEVFPESPTQRPRWLSGREWLDELQCRGIDLCSPTRRFWKPHKWRAFDVLTEAAEATGGAFHLPGLFTDRTASGVFKSVLQDYRQRYVLHYTPSGVAREGWHEVTVTVPAHSSYQIQARRGYVIDPPYRSAVASVNNRPGSPASATSRAIDDVVAAYDGGDYAAFAGHMRQIRNYADLLGEQRSRGNPWPDRPLREAAFVLELADAGLQSPRSDDRDAARKLLTAHRQLVRHPIEGDAFERFWLWAAVVVLEGANEAALQRAFADEALKRFPDEPRLVLARAFAADKSRPLGSLGGSAGQPLPSEIAAHVNDVAILYDAAMAYDETALEARVRKAWLLHRAGRSVDALAILDAAGDAAQDPFVAYLRHLFRGRILSALGRLDDAVAAYRAATALLPAAQSPRVGLMTAFVSQGNRSAAEAEAEAIQTLSVDAWDPWWRYWQGDYRRLPVVFARLRELAR